MTTINKKISLRNAKLDTSSNLWEINFAKRRQTILKTRGKNRIDCILKSIPQFRFSENVFCKAILYLLYQFSLD